MDLNAELRRVLDNPESVYEEIVTNLSSEARVTLMVFTSCRTPVDIVELQAAVARVSVEAATRFEASLRVLDDAFVSLEKHGTSRHAADFRNPSIEDFCCAYLNKNAGFALTVAAKKPSFEQLRRLIELSTAPVARGSARSRAWAARSGSPEPLSPRTPSGSRWMYPDLHAALVEDPALLIGSLLPLLPSVTVPSEEFRDVALALIDVVGADDPERVASPAALRSRLVPVLLKLDFQNHAGMLWALLDNRRRAQVTEWLLADRFEVFYRSVVESADQLTHFDTIVNFDDALGRSGEQAWWADRFEDFNDTWLEDVGDADDALAKRQYYEKVADHLDLGMRSALSAWEEAEAEAEAEAERSRQAAADAEDDWRDPQEEPMGGGGPDHQHMASIDAMFESLAQARSR